MENRKEINPSILAVTYMNFASIYNTQDRSYDIEKFLNKSCSIFQNILMNDHPAMGVSFNNLAGFYSNQGRYTEADFLYQKSLFILEKKVGCCQFNNDNNQKKLCYFFEKMGRFASKKICRSLVSKSNNLKI